jgi:hypothetical protein
MVDDGPRSDKSRVARMLSFAKSGRASTDFQGRAYAPLLSADAHSAECAVA